MKATGKKRLFIAVDISDEAREKISNYLLDLRLEWTDARVSWTKPENLHLTLKFLGDVEERRLDDVAAAVRYAAASNSGFQLEIGGTGVFPSPRKPKVIWLGISDSGGKLTSLFRQLEENCETIGFPPDEREFSPHLTIGRVRNPSSACALAQAHLENEFETIRFDVRQIVLYQSTLHPNGSIYTPIVAAPLSAI